MAKLSRIKTVLSDTSWVRFYIQRRLRSPTLRRMIANRVSRFRPTYTQQEPLLAKAGARNLEIDGLHSLGEILSTAKARELFDYFTQKPVGDPYRPWIPKFLPLSTNRHTEAHIAHHDASDILTAPHLVNLINDPRILDIASAFLGCRPTIGYISTWWSYPTHLGPQQAENFHRDVDDWRFIKLFVYLTDVNIENGPHQYVVKSAQRTDLTDIRRFSDDEVYKTFGRQQIRTITSSAGGGFLEDTYGLHRGQQVKSGHRLIFQAVYSLNRLPYAPNRPIAPFDESSGHDRWVNRYYFK